MSFDGLIVDFDDDDDYCDSGCSSGRIGDMRRGMAERGGEGGTVTQSKPHSVTSPSHSVINTGSTSFVNCGPNSSITSSANKWVLGVRHLSVDCKALNQRMAKRAKGFESDVNNQNDKCFVEKRETKLSASNRRMDVIEEDSLEVNEINDYQRNVAEKMMNKRLAIESAERQLKLSQENCEKFFCQPVCHKQSHALNDRMCYKSTPNPSQNKVIPKVESKSRDNGVKNDNYRKDDNIYDKSIVKTDFVNKENSHQMKTSDKLSTNFKRTVNSTPLSVQQELKRYRHQRLCETVSLITLIFGLLLVIFTPFLLIPIWVIPNPYTALFRNLFWLSLSTSIVLMTLATLTGNIYWYFDRHKNQWKWFFHCGKGPDDHYWGATLLHNHKPVKPSAKHRTNVSIIV